MFGDAAGMTHLKALLVDELWAVIGTTNFDNHRSSTTTSQRRSATGWPPASPPISRRSEQCKEITLRCGAGGQWEKLIGTVA